MLSLGERQSSLLELATRFLRRPLSYSFTAIEQRALRGFFTNLDGHVFFFHNVPSNVCASTIARYSRLKNERGIRGIWVEEFLPYLLAGQIQWVIDQYEYSDGVLSDHEDKRKNWEADFLKRNAIKSLDDFVACSEELANIFEEFVAKSAADPDYLQHFVDSKRAKRTLSLFMDSYGHNSIARGAFMAFCCENISILAAKTLEWTRPATGIIELSTRYVSMSQAQLYPIWDELAEYGVDPATIQAYFEVLFGEYRGLVGDEKKLDGPLPSFFRTSYADLVSDTKDLETGVTGETFDICGNLLPTAACTSVALVCSGEAFPTVLKHLILDGTPENLALCDLIVEESGKVGADQFARHYQPTEVDRRGWGYLMDDRFLTDGQPGNVPRAKIVGAGLQEAEYTVTSLFHLKEEFRRCNGIEQIAGQLFWRYEGDQPVSIRTTYDKLPSEFEAFTVSFEGVMSWRGWRDLHRMSFAAHNRTLVTPKLGFYVYDKPAPPELASAFGRAEAAGRQLYREAQRCGVPEFMLQYLLPMGFNIGYTFSANLRQHEFCAFQRLDYSVNHEVRLAFLAQETALRQVFPWWPLFSRGDITPAYVFARSKGPSGKGVPLPKEPLLVA